MASLKNIIQDKNGNVSIGTISPESGYKLDVRGNILAYYANVVAQGLVSGYGISEQKIGPDGTSASNKPFVVYTSEVGYNYDSATTFAETGPISIGTGEQITKVTKLIPDEITQGDVDVTFKTRFYPNATETTHGPFTPANPTSVRFSGRQLRMRVEGQRSTQWKVGNMRIDAIAGGRR